MKHVNNDNTLQMSIELTETIYEDRIECWVIRYSTNLDTTQYNATYDTILRVNCIISVV